MIDVIVGGSGAPIPDMPVGFTDRSAWDVIHWKFKPFGEFSWL